MLRYDLARSVRAAMLAVALLPAAPVFANINLPGGDAFLDGSFQGMTYATAGGATLSPRLYVGDIGSTKPPFDEVLGFDLEFSYDPPTFGSSVVTLTYRLTNNDFASFNDLRFMLDLKAQGQPSSLDQAAAVGFGSPAAPGDPDQFQIFDFAAPPPKPLQQIEANDQLNGGIAPACVAGCFSDLALQWNNPELLPGATWEITVQLVDDPSLLAGGGRYLVASSLGTDGAQIAFGNPTLVPEPETYAMLLAGLGLLAFLRMRRT